MCVILPPTKFPFLWAAKGTRQSWFVWFCIVSRYAFNIESAHNWMLCYPGLNYQTVKGMQGPGEIAANYRRHLSGLIAFLFNCMLIISSARQLPKGIAKEQHKGKTLHEYVCQSHRAIYQIKRRKNKLLKYFQETEWPHLPRNVSIQKYRIF